MLLLSKYDYISILVLSASEEDIYINLKLLPDQLQMKTIRPKPSLSKPETLIKSSPNDQL
jgi:hypothetical protein